MSRPRKLHLFNCDRTYKLDAVEELLKVTKAKLDFDSVEKHYFSLAQMSEMTTKTIPNLQMDMAVFVVHAHESRLSINEDNAGIGYAKIYRALLEATGGKVIIVIGGDDNYKNEDEEDRVFISRWAWRKISSQFSEEFLDGRKSFIFSWNKKHRAIHEEALVHYFDPSKKGQKFEYQPKPKQPKSGKLAQTSSERNPLQKYQSVDEQRSEGIKSGNVSSAEHKRGDFSGGRSRSADQPREPSSFSRPNIGEQRREDQLFGSTTGTATEASHSEHRAKSKETPSASTGTTKVTELAILGCNVSNDSIQAVRQVFKVIGPKLNLVANPPVENFAPCDVKRYLTENPLKFCVLMVDAETVKDAYDNLSQRKVEYEKLLETAADTVDKKVIILMCEKFSLKSKEDETKVSQTIERIINKNGKGFIAWLKNRKLSVDPDVLVQCLMSTSPALQPNPQTNPSRGFHGKISDAPGSAAESFCTNSDQSQTKKQPAPQAATIIQPTGPPVINIFGEPVLLRSILNCGRISYHLGDVQLLDPTFTVPDFINQNLLQQFGNFPEIGVTIVQGTNGTLRWSVDPKLIEVSRSRYKGIQIDANETLMLKTRIRDGLVSFHESDVHFRYKNWQIPQYIVESLKEEYCSTPCGELYIISDDGGNLRWIVKIGTVSRFRSFFNKRGL